MKFFVKAFTQPKRSIIRRITVIVLLSSISGSCFGSADPEFVAICGSCFSEQNFAQAAVGQVPDPRPGDGLARIYPVYVVNPRQGRVEFFNVHVQRNDGDISPYSTSSYEFGLYKTAYPAEGDPIVKAAILDAAAIAKAFTGALNDDIRADGVSSIGSAIDLLGPYDSPAGRNRNQLKLDLNDHYNSIWNQLALNFSDMTSRLASKFFGSDSVFTIDRFVTVEFEDGTTIQVRIDNILEAFDAEDSFAFEFDVLQHTARLPDGSTVPQTAGQFAGFSWSDSPAGPNLAQRLALLAALYGLDVGEPGEPLDCTMECNEERCSLNCSF